MPAAHGYEDLHRLLDRLTPQQARRLRLLIAQDEELSRVAEREAAPAGLSALIGAFDGPADLAERHDHYVAEWVHQRYGDPS